MPIGSGARAKISAQTAKMPCRPIASRVPHWRRTSFGALLLEHAGAYGLGHALRTQVARGPPEGNDAQLSDYPFAILGKAETKGGRAFVAGKLAARAVASRRRQQPAFNRGQGGRGRVGRIAP